VNAGPAAEDRGCGCLHAGGQASQAAIDACLSACLLTGRPGLHYSCGRPAVVQIAIRQWSVCVIYRQSIVWLAVRQSYLQHGTTTTAVLRPTCAPHIRCCGNSDDGAVMKSKQPDVVALVAALWYVSASWQKAASTNRVPVKNAR